MAQVKFTLEQSHINFLEQFKDRGFKDKSAIVPSPLNGLSKHSIANCLQTRPIDYRDRLVSIRGERLEAVGFVGI